MWSGHSCGGHIGEVLQELFTLYIPDCAAAPKSTQVWSYREEKQAMLLTTITGRSNIQDWQGGRNEDKTVTLPKLWPYFFNPVLREMENSHCGVIQDSGRLKASLWGGKDFFQTRKIWPIVPPSFCRRRKCGMGRTDLHACLAVWSIHSIKQLKNMLFPDKTKLKYSRPQQSGAIHEGPAEPFNLNSIWSVQPSLPRCSSFLLCSFLCFPTWLLRGQLRIRKLLPQMNAWQKKRHEVTGLRDMTDNLLYF